MRLLVYLKDGRTVIYVEGRGQLAKLMRRDPAHEDESIIVAKGTWNPHTGEYLWQRNQRMRFVASGSISHVEEGRPAEAAEMAKAEA